MPYTISAPCGGPGAEARARHLWMVILLSLTKHLDLTSADIETALVRSCLDLNDAVQP